MKTNIFSFFFFILSVGVFGQTLVNYPLNNNLNPNVGPDASITPTTLEYFDPPSTTPITNTQHAFGHFDYNNSGDYLQLDFNLPANENLTLQVTAGTAIFLSSVTGNIQIWEQRGSSPFVLLQQQDLNAANPNFPWIDISDISFSLPLSNTQSSAVPVKIRIVGNFTKSGLNIDYFGINNISLVREITSISVGSTKTPEPPLITHNAGASVTLDTDFGSLLTNEESVDKTYRITNTGTRTLNINSIQLSPGNVGFSVVGAVPSSIIAGGSATFTVRFAPVNQGLQTAEVVISGNITPDNPFRFEVKGAGKSCNLTPVPIAQYGFEGAPPSNMAVTQSSGNVKIIGGTTSNPTTSFGRLYYANNNNNTNLHSSSSPTRSWYIRGNDTGITTIEFGPVDLTNQQEVSINFDLAAFGLTNNNNSGVNNSDYVILSVYNPATNSWSDEIRLNGSDNTTRRKYAFGASGIAEHTYDGNNTAIQFTSNAINYGSFKLNIPASISQLRYRITAYTSRTWGWQNYNLWLIDNVHVDAGNAKSKTWNGTAWVGENANRPGPREKAVFAGDYNFGASGENTDLSVCECEVKADAAVTIPTGKAISVMNKVINRGDGTNFVVESDANLVQIENGAINDGNILVKRNMTFRNDERKEYNYFISPVEDANLKTGIYRKADQTAVTAPFVLYHNEANSKFYNSSGAYIPGRSLAVKEPLNSSGALETLFFSGRPFNGTLDFPLAYSGSDLGYNLVGNPYPSNLDLDELYNNNKSEIESTFKFWDNKVNGIYEQQGTAYKGAAYAIYNAAAGTAGTGLPAPGNGQEASGGTKEPNRIAKIGQGFMVKARGTGKVLKYNNSVRISDNDNSQFFGRQIQDDSYWLKISSPSGIDSRLAVVYFADGGNGLGDEDSEMTDNLSDAIFSEVEGERVLINGRSLFVQEDKILLGLRSFIPGQQSISAENLQGRFADGQKIYLKDKLKGTITDLSEGSYTFDTEAGEFTGRFEIIYKPETVLATDSVVKEKVQVYREGNQFVVRSDSKKITSLEVYDASGKLIYSVKPSRTQTEINAEWLANGMYILKIVQGNDVTVKKILK